MKQCPKCNSEVDDNFNVCWNCQYSFPDEKVLENSDFQVICPNCKTEVDFSLEDCPACGKNLSGFKSTLTENPDAMKKINCLRCDVQMGYQGSFKFHEGARIGVFGDLFEIFQNRERFILYVCPNCGKVEFFLPGF